MAVKTLAGLLDKMWQDYVEINPFSQRIANLFLQQGEKVKNDHIALRTFNHPRLNIDVMARPFIESGYKYCGDYHFPEKKLYAKHYEHPDNNFPKIFISELKLEELSSSTKVIINRLVDQVPKDKELEFDFVSCGRPWNLSIHEYDDLRNESDYASWLAAFGYRPNHFTVLINDLKNFSDIRLLNEYLKKQGFKLNSSGGEVKGSKEVYLEQSSILANNIEVIFQDGKLIIPACFYEFAKRYPTADGKLYQGFVATSADKIFESTNQGQ